MGGWGGGTAPEQRVHGVCACVCEMVCEQRVRGVLACVRWCASAVCVCVCVCVCVQSCVASFNRRRRRSCLRRCSLPRKRQSNLCQAATRNLILALQHYYAV